MHAAKKALRAEIARRVGSMSPQERESAGRAACTNLLGLDAYREAGVILAFFPMDDEIDTGPLVEAALAAGKRVVMPLVDWKARTMQAVEILSPGDVVLDGAGIPGPPPSGPVVEPSGIDLIVLPGRAFDLAGNRMGRGGGYYDKLLAGDIHAETVAIAFECQMVDSVPVSDHDMPVSAVVTESGVHSATGTGS